MIDLGAATLLAWLREGRLTAEALTRACLAPHRRARARGPGLGVPRPRPRAWPRPAHADAAQACRRGRSGALHGLPVGVKDIIDTADMPTENGTVLHAGRRPPRDAAVVARLRAAGAIMLGKTVTTELAVYTPGKTRNPRNLAHTPGRQLQRLGRRRRRPAWCRWPSAPRPTAR